MSKQIVEIFKDIVSKVEAKILNDLIEQEPIIKTIHYEHGHYIEINTTLNEREQLATLFNKKYPLVALFEDIREKVKYGISECSLTLVICFSTEAQYKSKDRYDNVINPILEPIYQELMKQIKMHPQLIGYDAPHTKIIRPYWGVEGKYGNRANIFSDFLDAIEISNLKVKYKKTNC